MLIIFKSPASGDVIMFEKNGKEMLTVLEKDPADPEGHLHRRTAPRRHHHLKAAIEADK